MDGVHVPSSSDKAAERCAAQDAALELLKNGKTKNSGLEKFVRLRNNRLEKFAQCSMTPTNRGPHRIYSAFS